eukprot:scaffold52769_cov63-Phaeocystis_antarctica.AAC.5
MVPGSPASWPWFLLTRRHGVRPPSRLTAARALRNSPRLRPRHPPLSARRPGQAGKSSEPSGVAHPAGARSCRGHARTARDDPAPSRRPPSPG